METKHQTSILERLLERGNLVADRTEVFKMELNSLSAGFRNGQLREIQESQDAGLCLRIIKNGKIAQVTTSNMDTALTLPEKAVELVTFGESVDFDFPGEPVQGSVQMGESADRDMDYMVDSGRRIVDKIKTYDPLLIPSASSSVESLTITILNSSGFHQSYTQHSFGTSAIAVLAEEGNILTTYHAESGQKRCTDPEKFADRVIEMVKIGRRNVSFKTETLPVLFTPRAVSDIMATLGAAISGSAIIKKTSPLTGKIGEQILHKSVSIIDDGLYPFANGTQPFDDEGVPCQRKYLIENGVLKNYLLDLKSAKKLGMAPTGNGFRFKPLIQSRGYVFAPYPMFTNLILLPGPRSSQEILTQMDRVVLIDQLAGVLLGNLINGDWSGNLEYGILYEHGEPVGRIKNAMTSGNFYTMFKDQYLESSSDREWVQGWGGSSSSSLFPYILFDMMTISA